MHCMHKNHSPEVIMLILIIFLLQIDKFPYFSSSSTTVTETTTLKKVENTTLPPTVMVLGLSDDILIGK